MTPLPTLRQWFLALGVTAVLVAATMAWVDRPLADFVSANIIFTPVGAFMIHSLEALAAGVAILLVIQGVAGIQALRGRPLGPWAEAPQLACWAALFAIAVAEALKRIVGRSEVYPLWIRSHVYRFDWLHGVSSDYQAFPSGTTAVATAVFAVISRKHPRLRWPMGAVVVLIALTLALTNSHWASDTIGGVLVGWTAGWMTVALLDRTRAA